MAHTARDRALQWWARTTTKIAGLPVAHAESTPGLTTITVVKRRRGERVIKLCVADHDLSELAHTDAGRWVIAQQTTVATTPQPPKAHWAKPLQYVLALVAGAAIYTAIVDAGQWTWAWTVFAVSAGMAAAWLARERHRARVDAVCAADRYATERYGPIAARTALQARPHLYRSAVHEHVQRRSRLSINNRLQHVASVL